MARYQRLTVLNTIIRQGIVPVFYQASLEKAKKIITACAEAGARCIEFTNRGDGAADLYAELENYCRTQYPSVILGIGSVIDAPTAALYISHGANFVVGPLLDKETAVLCNKRKIPYMPGCGSASEIHTAHELGVEICKMFPGGCVGGPDFVKAMKGPCPWINIMPTGGVDPSYDSLKIWFDAGIAAAGIGSKLISKELVREENYKKLTDNIKTALNRADEIRGY